MSDIKVHLLEAEEFMGAAIEYLSDSLARIRAGKANVLIVDGVRVEYYGSMVPLSNVATVSAPDPKTIAIQPWEKSLIPIIERAIINSDVGITPVNNGEIIRLNIPPLTEERRKQLVKLVRAEGEESKISVRNARRDAIDNVKKMVKDGFPEDMGKDAEKDIQSLHDKYIKKIENLLDEKETEVMTV